MEILARISNSCSNSKREQCENIVADTIIFRPNILRGLIMQSRLMFFYSILYFLFLSGSSSNLKWGVVALCAGVLLVLLLFVNIAYPKWYSVCISGKVVSGADWSNHLKRKEVPLESVDIAASRPGAVLRSGFLKLSDGSFIVLPRHFFSPKDVQDILNEILKRQKERGIYQN